MATTPATTTPTQPSPDQIRAAAEAEARLATLLALGDVYQANAATGIYGDSGTGKTTLCTTGIDYTWTRYHRTSRYVAADLGGFGNKLLRQVRLGIASVYNPTNHLEPFETMELLSLGYWPETIDDPFTGYAAPDVKLVPPYESRWVIYCPNGHIVHTVTKKAALNGFSRQCPTCRQAPVTPQTWSKVEELIVRAPGVKHVGMYVFDSGTALEDWAMEDMASRAARNDPTIKDGNALSSTGARILSGDMAFGANTIQHYGFAQTRMRGWIKNARTIRGMVMPPIFTFLEERATDDTKKMVIYGPKIAGSAKTSDVPAWLGNCLHASKEENERGKVVHRLWLQNHIDRGSTVPHLAKTRAEPGTMPEVLEDKPDEPLLSRFSLGYFFDLLETSLATSARQDAEEYPDAPRFAPFGDDVEEVVGKRDLSEKETIGRGAPARMMPQAPVIAAATISPAKVVTALAGPPVPPAQPIPARPAPAVVGPKVMAGPPAKPAAVVNVPVTVPAPVPAAPAASQPAKPANVTVMGQTRMPAPVAAAPVAAAPVASPTPAQPQPQVARPAGSGPARPPQVHAMQRVGTPPPAGRKP